MTEAPVAVDLPTLAYGETDAPRSVLIVHGLTSSSAAWWRVAPRIAAAGHRVVVPDLRGHGRAPRTESYRMADYAADLLRLRPAHGGAWDLVIGHSLGGGAVTAALGTHPGWARAALLLDPAIALVGADAEARAEFVAGLRQDTVDTDPAHVAAQHPGWTEEDVWAKARSGALCSPYVVERTVADNEPWDVRDAFERIAVPVTILGADPTNGEAVTPPEIGEPLAAAHPNLAFRAVVGAEHGIQRTHPEVVVAEALAAVGSAAAG